MDIIPKKFIPDSLIRHPSSLLLHSCCAPCTGGIIKTLLNSGVTPTVLFYNPNIHPEEEYEHRKDTLLKFLYKENIAFIDADYDPDLWFQKTAGLEDEKEQGKRCDQCFALRLEFSAKTAQERGFQVFFSSFGISRWKDLAQVNRAGSAAAAKYNVLYWDYNWRKNGGQELMAEIARQEQFYQQSYCGCKFSQKN